MGRFEDAEAELLAGQAATEAVFGRDHPQYATALNNLSNLWP